MMRQHNKKLLLVACLIAAAVLIRVSGVSHYLTFENFVKHKRFLQSYVDAHYVSSVLLFILLYVIVVALSVPGSAVLTISGGFLFGTLTGIIYSNIGATTGALCVFLLTRHLLGNWLQKKYGAQLLKFNEEMERHGPNYLLTLRFIPIFPFFLVNIFGGLTKVRFRTFLWTTTLGILPGDAVYTFSGSQLGRISSVEDVFSVNMLIVLLLLAIFSLIPVLYNHLKRKGPDASVKLQK
jgi:uncharacterized membrane protein YdjX (TVP38/TMEM64 family)